MQPDHKKFVESILYVSARPTSAKEIALTLAIQVAEVEKIINELSAEYADRGLRIVKKGNDYLLTTAPENAKIVSKFLNEDLRGEISKASLETLALVFYKQPVTRMDVEEVRGVNSAEVLRQLLIRGLIEEVGRKEAIGRPILYGTTMEFLNFMGVESHDAIPKIEEFMVVETLTETVEEVVQ